MILCARPNPQFPFERSVKIFKEIGIKLIRFDVMNVPHEKKDNCLDFFVHCQDLVKKAGLSFGEFHCFSVGDIETFERLALLYLKMMKLSGCKYLSQHINENLLEHKAKINAIITQFKDAGIFFCIENMPPGHGATDFKAMDAILEALPDAHIALDVGHSFLVGIDPLEFYNRYKDKVRVIHLHDVTEDCGKFTDHTVPFTGRLLECPDFVKVLQSFEHPIVLELRTSDPEKAAQLYAKSFDITNRFLLKDNKK